MDTLKFILNETSGWEGKLLVTHPSGGEKVMLPYLGLKIILLIKAGSGTMSAFSVWADDWTKDW
jgi:hypothetical protein